MSGDRLARLDLTGGAIHNVALNAAFLAAQTNSLVTMPLILEAARTEFRKLGRFINEGDFEWKSTDVEPVEAAKIETETADSDDGEAARTIGVAA